MYHPPNNARHSQNHKIDTLKFFMESTASQGLVAKVSQRLYQEKLLLRWALFKKYVLRWNSRIYKSRCSRGVEYPRGGALVTIRVGLIITFTPGDRLRFYLLKIRLV